MTSATQNTIIPFFEVDISKIRVEPPQEGKTGNKQSLVKSDQFPNGRVVCRIPEGTMAFALAEFKDKKTGIIKNPGKFNIQLKLDGSENGEEGMTPQAKMLYKFFTALENHLKTKIAENDTYNAKHKLKNIQNSYKSSLKQGYNSEGEPYSMTLNMRVKFNPNDRKFITMFYDSKNKNAPIPVSYENSAQMIPRGTTGIWDIAFNRIWYGPMGCGLTIDVERASVKVPEGIGGLPPMPIYEEPEGAEDEVEHVQAKLASMAQPSGNMEMEDGEVEAEAEDDLEAPSQPKASSSKKASTSTKKTTTKAAK